MELLDAAFQHGRVLYPAPGRDLELSAARQYLVCMGAASLILFAGALRLIVQAKLSPVVVGVAYGVLAGVLTSAGCMHLVSVAVALVCNMAAGVATLYLVDRLEGWKYWAALLPAIAVAQLAASVGDKFDDFLQRDACLDAGRHWKRGRCTDELPEDAPQGEND